MAIYKVKYIKECIQVMEVEANSEEEAKKKYEDFDCIEDYEDQGLREELVSIKLKE